MRQRIQGKPVIAVFGVALFFSGLLTVIFTLQALSYRNIANALNNEMYDKAVIIDPGHGGPDGGAVGVDGVVEKGINLSISLKLRSFFLASGYTVIMVREDDRTICDKGCDTIRSMKTSDLHNRLKISNEHPKALFISIHQNIYTSSKYSGAQIFYSANNTDSKDLAQFIQGGIKSMLQPDNTREIKPAQDNLYILYHAKAPAIMVECGFLSNAAECKKLEDDAYQNQMAFAIFNGALQFYSQH